MALAGQRDERSHEFRRARDVSPLAIGRVVFLLESLPDVLPAAAIAAWDSAGGHSAPGPVALELSKEYRGGSYSELLRWLARQREAAAELYRAVRGRYLEADRRVMVLPVVRTRWGARVRLPVHCELAGGLAPTTGGSARVVVRRWAWDGAPCSEQEPCEGCTTAGVGVVWLAERMHGGRTERIVVPRELVAA